jgi:hypothetical protein
VCDAVPRRAAEDREEGGERPRKIPVRPELARILREWWEEGFELLFCRRPTLDDFICPHPEICVHSKSPTSSGFAPASRPASETSHCTRPARQRGEGGANSARVGLSASPRESARGDWSRATFGHRWGNRRANESEGRRVSSPPSRAFSSLGGLAGLVRAILGQITSFTAAELSRVEARLQRVTLCYRSARYIN